MNLQAILAKDPSTLSDEERRFLQKHASELSDDQLKKFNISDDDDESDEDDDESGEDDDESDEDDDEFDEDDDDDPDESDDAETLRKRLKTAVSQRDHHRKKREAAEAALRAAEEESGKKKKKKISSSSDDGRYGRERTDFRFDHPYLKSSIVDQVEAYARAKNISMREAAKDDIVRLLIKKAKKRYALNSSSMESGHRSTPNRGNRKDWVGASKKDLDAEARRRREAANEE